MDTSRLDLTLRMSVLQLADLCGIFHACIWDLEQPLSVIEVLRNAYKKNRSPIEGQFPWTRNSNWTRQEHVSRISWLLLNGWGDPINLDFDTPFYCGWPVIDGLHRLAAAFSRLDPSIEVVAYGNMLPHKELIRAL